MMLNHLVIAALCEPVGILTLKEFFFLEFYKINPILDWNYMFPINYEPTRIPFGAKSIEKIWLQYKLGIIYQD